MSHSPTERDLRAKISAKADQALAAIAHARGCDKQDVLREVLDRWVDQVIHESTLLLSWLPREGATGSGGDSTPASPPRGNPT